MERRRPPKNLFRYAGVGIEFFLVFMIFFGGGWLLDRWLGTSPGFTVLGGIVGFAVAYYRITRQGWGILKGEDEESPEDQPEDQDRREDQDKDDPDY